MTARPLVVAAVLAAGLAAAVAACGPRREDASAAGSQRDSTAVPATAAVDTSRTDSATAPADTSKAVPTSGSAATKARPDSNLGRDSAYGPKFGIDSKGNVTPLPKKP